MNEAAAIALGGGDEKGSDSGPASLNRRLSPEELRRVAEEGYKDPVFFCTFFLPHLFPAEVPWVHRGLLAILTGKVDFLLRYGELDKLMSNFIYTDENGTERQVFRWGSDGKPEMHKGRFTLIMMPRGSGKTTIAGIAMPLYDILYGDIPFTVYVSEAAPHAKMQLHNVQRELIDNRRIEAVFGAMKPALRDDEKWSGDFFETKSGMAMCARGRGGQVRGLNHRGQRPKRIRVDDVEDQESVATEMQRNKTREWAYGDLMPALPELDDDASVVAMGTLLHNESLMQTWAKDDEWTVVKFGVFDREGEPIWPRFMDAKKLERRKRSFAKAGQLHTFYLEYFNEARAPDVMVFRQEWFHYTPDVDDVTHTAIYVDPAISPKRKADQTAIIVCGMTDKGFIKVLDFHMQRGMSDREKVDWYFDWSKKWKVNKHGVESVAYQVALVHLMREEMFRKKHYFEIDEVKHKVRKTERIRGIIQPRLCAGYLQFRIRWSDLETQMLDFRSDTDDQSDDGPDALAGCISLLDPYAAQAAGDVDLSEDEYEPLEQELGGEWRTH